MRKEILFFMPLFFLGGFSVQKNDTDPTGTYQLDSKAKQENGEIYGYSGHIQVKKISSEKIVMTFEVNKGAPSYNSGSFVDTLNYQENRAMYTNLESDSTCKITFNFTNKGVTVKEVTADYNSGCGFGHAVVADGFYKKISSKMPILTSPLTGERLDE